MQNMMNQPVDSIEKKSKVKVHKEKDEKKEKVRYLIDDEYFSSHVQQQVMILFVDERYPTRKMQPFIPFISYMRNMLIGIFLFLFVRFPYAQVSIIGIIEIVYTIMILMLRTKAKRLDNIIDVFNTLTNSSFVSLKFLTVCNIDDDNRQQVVGRIMVGVLVINFIGNIVYVVYSIIMTVRDVLGCTGGDDKDETTTAMNSRWKHIIIYEYPVQPLVFDGQREATPIVVEELEEDMNGRPLVMPKPRMLKKSVLKKNVEVSGGVNGMQISIKKLKFSEVEQKEVEGKEREDMNGESIEEKVVFPKKVFIRGKKETMREREESSTKQKVIDDRNQPSSDKMGKKSKDGDVREDIGLYSRYKVEKMEIQDDIIEERISEEEVGLYY